MDCEILLKLMLRATAYMRREPQKSEETGASPLPGFGTILDILAERDGVSQAQVVREAKMRQQSVSTAVAALEKRGYVSFAASETDKRACLIFLTDEGRCAQQEVQRHRRQAAEQFFACLSDNEKDALGSILLKLTAE